MSISIRSVLNIDTYKKQNAKGFTIVELLIVVVVIAILAAIVIVSYNGVSTRAKETALRSDLRTAGTQLQILYSNNGIYPASLTDVKKSQATNLNYVYTANSFCLQGSRSDLPGRVFSVSSDGSVTEGSCTVTPVTMQTITNANCPTTRTLVNDIRDNHSYWVQRLADGRCWMMTNLAYAGGGANTYGDAKVLQDGTGDSVRVVGQPKYYVQSNANATNSPALPSISTDGGATTPQYGYLYNWCAATGRQTSTAACAETATPLPSTSISICPAGWRLPTGGASGEYMALNAAINGASTSTDQGLRTAWLIQRSGFKDTSFADVNNGAYYWASTQRDAWLAHALVAFSDGTYADSNGGKGVGFAVRCVAV